MEAGRGLDGGEWGNLMEAKTRLTSQSRSGNAVDPAQDLALVGWQGREDSSKRDYCIFSFFKRQFSSLELPKNIKVPQWLSTFAVGLDSHCKLLWVFKPSYYGSDAAESHGPRQGQTGLAWIYHQNHTSVQFLLSRDSDTFRD